MINYETFYTHGFSEVALDPHYLQAAADVVYKEVWKDVTKDGVRRAAWSGDVKQDIDPPQYRSFLQYVDSIMNESFVGYQRSEMTVWTGARTLDWHYDGSGTDGIYWLIYFSKDQWSDEIGGFLEVKNDMIGQVYRFAPTYGTAIVLNCQDRSMLHRVTPSLDKRRGCV